MGDGGTDTPNHWLQKPVIPFMILAIVIGCSETAWGWILHRLDRIDKKRYGS